MIRKTKIVCTLGPASDSEEMISKLMDAGMNVCRLNMSHGSYEEQGARIDRIKRLRAEKNIPVAIMLDTKGPEVRTKTLKGDKVTLQAGQDFILTSRDIEGDETQVSITYPKMVDLVHAGTRVLIDDGLIALDVKQIVNGTDIVCTVINGGVLGGRKGISVPDVDLQMPSIGEKDRSDIIFGIEKGIDLIAASFVCRPSDVLTIRKLCADNGGSHVQIFSKIENRMGVNNFDEILKVSDGIMVARGDLGVEVDMEEVPVLQKQFIHKCNVGGQAGHHRDADARLDDRESPPDPRGNHGRRQRDLRRYERDHALRRDCGGQVPSRSRAHDGCHRAQDGDEHARGALAPVAGKAHLVPSPPRRRTPPAPRRWTSARTPS